MSDITSSKTSEAQLTSIDCLAINAANLKQTPRATSNMNCLMQANSMLLLLALLLAASMSIQSVDARFRDVHGGAKFGTVVDTRGRSYRRLHEILSIGDDPSQDIRTNILLNMEGL